MANFGKLAKSVLRFAMARIQRAERDAVAFGIAIAAIILFVGTGGTALSLAVRALTGDGVGPNQLLVNALLLNIALVIFGWRRHEALAIEVDQRRTAEARARLLAETDPLTGCLNRRSIGPATEDLLARATARGEAVAFVMIDLDNFKQVNDCHGHSVGDGVIRETAIRIADAIPPGALLARLGGDEFACVLAFDPAHGERIDALAALLIERVSAPVACGTFNDRVTVSVGLTRSDARTRMNEGEDTAAALLHMADIAMYQVKKQGRNCHAWFEDTMESELRYRSELEIAIRHGIPAGEFVPFYEQQIDLATGELVGFEMLARWQSPRLGLIGPEVFIPIAEEIGVIGEMSESLIAQALRDARQWDPALTLSVNVSPIQLRDPWFAQKILKLLVEANFPANRLEIEITESCLHQNITGVHTLVTSLKNQGIAISLDDFGTGYSSLAQLRTLPFDRLKIDRSFVTNMIDDRDAETIVQTIKALGEGFGMPVTAEGIESQAVLDRLTRLGSFKGQGYLYGRPQPASAITAMLAERAATPAPAADPADSSSDDAEAAARRRA